MFISYVDKHSTSIKQISADCVYHAVSSRQWTGKSTALHKIISSLPMVLPSPGRLYILFIIIRRQKRSTKKSKRKKLDFKLRGLGNGEIRYHEVRMCVSEKAYARSFLPRLKRVCKEKLE